MPLPPTFPELGALDLYLSVVRLGSVSRAAAAHGIAQPSASSRIRTLERQVGVRLLERSPAGSVPTADGAVVAGWAEEVLRAADRMATGIAALRAEAAGVLRLAASFTIAEYLLPPWLEQFRHAHPDDTISLEVANSATVVEHVVAGTVDLGFVETPLPTPGLRQRVVATDELIVVVGVGHPWARRPSISLDTLAATPLVLREAGSGTRDALESALLDAGYDAPVSAMELGSTSAVRAAVAAGGSPTVISRLAVESELTTGSLVRIDVPDLVVERQLRAVWTRSGPLAPLARTLLDRLPELSSG